MIQKSHNSIDAYYDFQEKNTIRTDLIMILGDNTTSITKIYTAPNQK